MVLGKTIRLEKDVSDVDKYGRLLRYVFDGDTLINDKLVRDGFAKATTYLPNKKYQDKFKESENLARENKLGLWASCKSV